MSDETPFLILVASAAFLVAASPDKPSDKSPSWTKQTKVSRLSDTGWGTSDWIIVSGKPPRYVGGAQGDWSDAGTEAFISIVLGITPAEAKAECEKNGRIMCCGSSLEPPCVNFCWCNSTFTATSTSCFCVCAEDGEDDDCPDPPEAASF